MPVQPCQSNGKPGLRWGRRGKCYTYTAGDSASRRRAHNLAAKQGRAVKAGQSSSEKIAEGLRAGQARRS